MKLDIVIRIICLLLIGAASLRADPATHWAFAPVRMVSPPEVGDPAGTHPIDRFIRARQLEQGLEPVGPADRRTLLRRAYFDLIGLPPSPERARAFLADDSPEAFEHLLGELLASPRYGERWGRHWLDLARYADTAGENSDFPIPQAHLYRDYVIDAFNDDMPYDRFVREQIAGDILGRQGDPKDYAGKLVATGFLAQAKRFGTGDLQDLHLIIEDTLDTMGKVILGLGMSCARCHDHKHDPTSMRDYYGLYSFFQRTSYPFPGGESVREQRYFKPAVHPAVLGPADAAYFAKHQVEIDRLKELVQAKRDPKSNQERLDAIMAQSPSRRAPQAYAVSDGEVADTYIHKLGNPRSQGAKVNPGVPAFLGGHGVDIAAAGSGRLELARWLTSPDNPLTARVMVNRIWQFHFGRPIVPTPSNFGLSGEAPTHPDLLDWLSRRFVESGWSIKAMHRLIMTSRTWQRANDHHAANAARDSANAFYWRFDRRRLDAEAIRDSMLQLGGNLDLERPGPHPFPPADKWRFSAHRQFKAVYPSNHRSVYLMVQRLHPHPYLALFNGPDTSTTTAERDRSMVPLQALFMSNSGFVAEQSRGLAETLLAGAGDAEARVRDAHLRVFSRPPTASELRRALDYLDQYGRLLAEEGVKAGERPGLAWASYAKTLITANEFLFVD
ncbi:MAG: DUF1553 domain-containing protein [Verrucomicrobiae bacterium]|nr:DUF1553 domain-containing protein [Verrucomicrobiae bacterium]